MHKLLVVMAAVAAGMMTFAANAQEGGPTSPRMHQNTEIKKAGAPAKPAKGKSSKAARAGQAAKTAKANEPCPYLFGCNDAKKDSGKKLAAKVEKKTAAKADKKTGAKVDKKTVAKAGRKSTHKVARKPAGKMVDPVETASIKASKDAGSAQTAAVGGGGNYSAIISRYAATYGVPVSLANAVVSIESNYQPNLTGSAGEVGLMQIKPSTARMLGYSGSVKELYNPETNIKYGMKYLAMAQDLGGGTTCGTILKYNAGHAATRMNPVSSAYCSKVKVQMAALGAPA